MGEPISLATFPAKQLLKPVLSQEVRGDLSPVGDCLIVGLSPSHFPAPLIILPTPKTSSACFLLTFGRGEWTHWQTEQYGS